MLQISEIMYDLKTGPPAQSGSDDGREWVEIRNISNEAFDLSDLKFFEDGINHKIKIVQGDTKILPQSYAIIVSSAEKFKIDHPNFQGSILDSTFSLNNSGELLALKNGEVILDQYFYNSGVGGAGDGKSLQKINDVWLASLPTPGTPACNVYNQLAEDTAFLMDIAVAGGENKISLPPPSLLVSKPKIISEKKIEVLSKSIVPKEIPPIDKISVATNNLTANTTSIVLENSNLYFYIGILIFLISVGIGAVYFIRPKKIFPKIGEDFEISEE